MRWVKLLLLGNILVVLGYLFFGRKKGEEKRCVLRALIMLFCPVIAPLCFGLGYGCRTLFFYKAVDLSDVIFQKKRTRTAMHADYELERNLAPLQEALSVTPYDRIRRLLLNILKEHRQNTLVSITEALDCDDSETAHYAASVLQSTLDEFRDQVATQIVVIFDEKYLNENTNDNRNEVAEKRVQSAEALFSYMLPILKQHPFQAIEQEQMVLTLEQVGQFLRKSASVSASQTYELVHCLLEENQWKLAQDWVDWMKLQNPNSSEAWNAELRVLYAKGEYDTFLEKLAQVSSKEKEQIYTEQAIHHMMTLLQGEEKKYDDGITALHTTNDR